MKEAASVATSAASARREDLEANLARFRAVVAERQLRGEEAFLMGGDGEAGGGGGGFADEDADLYSDTTSVAALSHATGSKVGSIQPKV